MAISASVRAIGAHKRIHFKGLSKGPTTSANLPSLLLPISSPIFFMGASKTTALVVEEIKKINPHKMYVGTSEKKNDYLIFREFLTNLTVSSWGWGGTRVKQKMQICPQVYLIRFSANIQANI